MAAPAPEPPTPTSTGLSTPADPRLAAVLAVVWRHGLFPSLVAGAFAYLLYTVASSYTRQLEAVERKVDAYQVLVAQKFDAHQASMVEGDHARALTLKQQNLRLKGICYGVTEEGSSARSFCDGSD